jgi:3-hydroxybutyryl-CoA dehydrogenase
MLLCAEMKIGIIGELTRFEELKQTLPPNVDIVYDDRFLTDSLDSFEFVFDLNFDEHLGMYDLYLDASPKVIIILSSALIELQSIPSQSPLTNNIFGMNCIPGFINRSVKEISYHNESQKPIIDAIASKLNWEIAPVKDRVGMVTPRILFMIINEAYYTLQEGTASKDDIDTAMKLGTNYPYGPFEWCEKIGVKTVVKMLQNIYEDTRDERYKICALLKTESYRY